MSSMEARLLEEGSRRSATVPSPPETAHQDPLALQVLPESLAPRVPQELLATLEWMQCVKWQWSLQTEHVCSAHKDLQDLQDLKDHQDTMGR